MKNLEDLTFRQRLLIRLALQFTLANVSSSIEALQSDSNEQMIETDGIAISHPTEQEFTEIINDIF